MSVGLRTHSFWRPACLVLFCSQSRVMKSSLNACLYVMPPSIHTCAHRHTHTYKMRSSCLTASIHSCAYIHVHTYMCIHTCAGMCIHTCAYIHVPAYMCIHRATDGPEVFGPLHIQAHAGAIHLHMQALYTDGITPEGCTNTKLNKYIFEQIQNRTNTTLKRDYTWIKWSMLERPSLGHGG